jgi:hypothetical protein
MGARQQALETGVRTCRKCAQTKACEEFITHRGLPCTLCRACNAEVGRSHYAANREERKAAERARRAARLAVDAESVSAEERYRYWERKKRDPIGYTLARLKRAAKAKGVPFDLTRDDIFIPEHCPVLGIRLRAIGTGRGHDCPEADRLVPELGYVRGNVSFISHRANRLKDNATPDELERVAAWMRARARGT